jgi:exodeoxyribonuclease-3
MQLRLMTYNILYGGIGREAQLLEVIRTANPDLVLLQEVTRADVITALAKTLKLQHFIAKGNRFSVALLSRFPILEANTHNQFPLRDSVLEASIQISADQRLYIIGVHPIAFPGTFFEYWRNWELSIALKRALMHHEDACLIAGDFNAISPHDRVVIDTAPRIMHLLYGLQLGYIFRHAMRKLLATRFLDCYRHLHPTQDGFTIPTPNPKVRLDYILANQRLAPRLTSCDVVTAPDAVHRASDHYPLVADFELG